MNCRYLKIVLPLLASAAITALPGGPAVAEDNDQNPGAFPAMDAGNIALGVPAEPAQEEEQPDNSIDELGITVDAVPDVATAQLKLRPGQGLVVTDVEDDGPAAKAGIEANDILLLLEDQILVNADQLQTLVSGRKNGEAIALSLLHQGKPTKVTATLRKDEEAGAAATARNQYVLQDANGTTMITEISDGSHQAHLKAVDKKGKLLFDGDIETADQRAKIPSAVMKRIEGVLTFDAAGSPHLKDANVAQNAE